jgi:hypothetical protein
VLKIAAGKPDRYKGFVPGEGFGLNTNPCGRSWSWATAAMASGQLAYVPADAPLSLPSHSSGVSHRDRVRTHYQRWLLVFVRTDQISHGGPRWRIQIAAGKPDRYKGFVPSGDLGLNTNPCGRSWSCATAAMASGQLAYVPADAPPSLPSHGSGVSHRDRVRTHYQRWLLIFVRTDQTSRSGPRWRVQNRRR